MGKGLIDLFLAVAIGVTQVCATAQQGDSVSGDKATDMVVDAVVMRPSGWRLRWWVRC
jgi:hypothetical protein